MARLPRIAAGFAAGATVMYFFDPNRGKRRRALVRDRAASEVVQSRDALRKTSRDLVNRGRGISAAVRQWASGSRPDGDTLEARVRSRIGRVVSHPHAIRVRSEPDGRVVVEGSVLASEAPRLLSAVRSVKGVRGIENRLEIHREADIPALQGGSPQPGERFELLQNNWTPAIRMAAGVAGAALVARGLRSGGFRGILNGAAGGCLLLRASTNMGLRQALGADSGRCAVDVQKTMHIAAPVEQVYSFWAGYQNFPRFMSHLREVHDRGNGRSHWVAAGPAGVSVAWDAEITENIPNRIIAWRSVPGSRVKSAGVVRFDPDTGGTRVTVRMSYSPPAGVLGHVVASLFGADPRREMNDDLVRLKSLIEFGRTRAHGETVRRDQLAAQRP